MRPGAWLLAVGILGALLAGCGDDESTASAATSTTGATVAQLDASVDDTGAFCAVAAELEGERPATYVGSPEHIADAEALAGVAPPAVADDADTFRDFLVGGGVDTEVPDSRMTTNWPEDVQTAVRTLTEFIARTC